MFGMVVEAFGILLLLSITIILGYIGSVIFERTKIPDVIWLLLLGLLLGPVFHVFPTEAFMGISSLMAALALIIILYDAGLNMEFYQVIKEVSRGMLLNVVNIVLTTVFVAFFAMLVFNFSYLQAFLLGVLLSSTSSEIIITTMKGLNVRDRVKMLLDVESVLSDPFAIVATLALTQVMMSGASLSATASSIAAAFSIAIVIGSVVGMAWLMVLDRLRGRPFDYMLTLAAIFILYVVSESVGGSGALSVLAFGIVLGNAKTFSEMFRFSKVLTVDELLKKFNMEISFFVRSFFFVYLGLIASINPQYALYGLGVAAMLILARLIGAELATFGMGMTDFEEKITGIMGPRGLATAVLSQLPLVFGLPGAEIYSNVAFVVILATVIYTAVMTSVLSRKMGRAPAPPQPAAVTAKPAEPRKRQARRPARKK
ncbi:MAG: cation:proton antiporter [Candidatus Aenigmatarchaeota archaeon]